MYSMTPKALKCSSDNQRASSSSMVPPRLSFQRWDNRFYDSFHPGTAGSFDQNMSRGQLGQLCHQVGDVVECVGTIPESGRGMSRLRTKSEKYVYAAVARVGADFRMHGGAVGSEDRKSTRLNSSHVKT